MALEGRKDGISSLLERLMAFMFTQAFISDEGDEQDGGANEDADKGSFSVEYCRVRDKSVLRWIRTPQAII